MYSWEFNAKEQLWVDCHRNHRQKCYKCRTSSILRIVVLEKKYKCTKWPQNDIQHYNVKVYVFHLYLRSLVSWSLRFGSSPYGKMVNLNFLKTKIIQNKKLEISKLLNLFLWGPLSGKLNNNSININCDRDDLTDNGRIWNFRLHELSWHSQVGLKTSRCLPGECQSQYTSDRKVNKFQIKPATVNKIPRKIDKLELTPHENLCKSYAHFQHIPMIFQQ